MTEIKWRRGAELSELEIERPFAIQVDDEEILLIRRDTGIIAVGNICPHHGAPMDEGFLANDQIVCPWHNARFDLEKGLPLSPPALDGLPVYETKVEGGAVFVGQKKTSRISMPRDRDGRTVLIVGAGAAGNAAAETLRAHGFAGAIKMLTREKDLPYDRPNLSKPYLSQNMKDEEMPLRSRDFYDRLRIGIVEDCTVQSLDCKKKKVMTAKGETFLYDQCLLATGGRARRLNVPGKDLNRVFSLRTWEDGRKLRKALAGAHQILVVGAGFIGLECAASLRDADYSVHIAAPETVFMERLFGPEVGRFLRNRHEQEGVRIHLGHTVKAYHGDHSGQLREAELTDGTMLPVELVIEGLGMEPVIDYLDNTDLTEEGAVPVNGRMQTRCPDVYAAGDIARLPDPVTGEQTRFEHWVEAERQGKHAALCMLGGEADYSEIPFFWTRQYGQSLKYIGNARTFDEIAVRGNIRKGRFMTGYYHGGRLLAAAAMGMDAELYEVEKTFKRGESISVSRFESGSLQ